MSIAEIHQQVAKEEQAKSASRWAPTGNSTTVNLLRRSTSLAAAPKMDDEGFVSISRTSMKKVSSKPSMGPPTTSPGGFKKPGDTSLRRAVSQPGFVRKNDVADSAMDPDMIPTQLLGMVTDDPPKESTTNMEQQEQRSRTVATPDQCLKKIQSILKEYYVGCDTDDAVLSVDELVQATKVEEGALERGAKVIEGATLLAMEGKPTDVPKMLNVMVRCVKEGKVPNASIIKGFQEPLELMADIEIDAPLAGKHLALIIAECLQLKALELNFLVDESFELFRTNGKSALFAIQVL